MLYKFGNFETEIDNTDISFLEKCFKGAEELKNVSIEGDMF